MVHASGQLSIHPVTSAPHPAWLGPTLTGAVGSGSGQYAGAVIPCAGVHVDCRALAMGWWATWEAPDAPAVARLWPGWRAEFWRDDYRQQVSRCDGALVLPAEDTVTALEILTGQLRSQVTGYGEHGNPVAGFVRAPARPARKAPDEL